MSRFDFDPPPTIRCRNCQMVFDTHSAWVHHLDNDCTGYRRPSEPVEIWKEEKAIQEREVNGDRIGAS